MQISILLPTFNGAKTIVKTLESLSKVVSEGIEWEILVCINNSTDNTENILKQYSSHLPLSVYHCKNQGKSSCLNLLLQNARGELLVFTDDDVIIPENWLIKIIELAATKVNHDIFGGRIKAYYGDNNPSWLPHFRNDHIAYGNTPSKFTYQEVGPGTIFGACFFVRSSALNDNITFNEDIGPNGKNYMMGCETDFLTRLATRRHKCWFDQDFTVQHIISQSQLEFSWLEKRAYRYGLSMYDKDLAKNFEGTRAILGIPLWRVKLFIQSWFKARLGSKKDPQYANYAWEVGFFKGYLNRKFNL